MFTFHIKVGHLSTLWYTSY